MKIGITVISIKAEHVTVSAIQNRKIIAANLEDASESDNKAAEYLKAGNYERAAYYAILSQEYIRLASEKKREDMALHALYN